MLKAVIMAGGLGTRLSSITNGLPKPMIDICGKPLLERQIECLKSNGIVDITFVLGFGANVISDYFGDGSTWGVNISYVVESTPLGTAGGLYYLKDKIKDAFFLINGDVLFDVDLKRMHMRHKQYGAEVTLFTHPNDHPYDSALVVADGDGKVTKWVHKEEKRGDYNNRVNAGIHLLEHVVFKRFFEPTKTDLDRDVLKPLVPKGVVYAYDSPEYVKDLGTPDRYARVCKDFESGLVCAKNLNRKQKAVFLDRDGTINRHVGFITSPDELTLLPDAAKAIRRLNESEYLAIVITNQPVIARGGCSFQDLEKIHRRMERLLGDEGAYIDGLYFCPHHPAGGFEGEVADLKIDCDCRKPKPGLLLKAKADFNICLESSYMVGDHMRDIEAGEAAGCKTKLISSGSSKYTSLLAAVNEVLEENNQSMGGNANDFAE